MRISIEDCIKVGGRTEDIIFENDRWLIKKRNAPNITTHKIRFSEDFTNKYEILLSILGDENIHRRLYKGGWEIGILALRQEFAPEDWGWKSFYIIPNRKQKLPMLITTEWAFVLHGDFLSNEALDLIRHILRKG